MIFKKSILGMAMIILLCATAYGYETRLLSEIPLKNKVSALAVNTATDTAAVVSDAAKSLAIIDAMSYSVTHEIALPETPSGVAVHKGLNRAFVSTIDGSLLMYDLKSGELAGTIVVGSAIYSVAVDEPTNRVFIGVDNGITIADPTTGNVLSTIRSSGKNVKLCLGKSFMAVVSEDDNGAKLRIIDPVAGSVTVETTLPGKVLSIDLDEPLGYVLVTLADKPGLFIYNATTLKPLDGIQTGKQVEIVSVNPSTHTAVLADTTDGSLSIADISRKALVETLPLFGQMGPVCMDTARNRVLVAHNEGLAVVQLENPVPRIIGLVPQEKGAGEEGFPLTITGEKFVKDSRTRFGGTLFDSLFDSNELIRAYIPADKLLMPGDVPVSVVNPPPGGGVSNELTFKILTPAPQLSAISPATAVSGGQAFTLRVEGKSFLPVAVVNFNGKKLVTNFLSSTVLEATVDAASIAAKGSYPVSVTSNGPTSFTSNSLSITVVSAEEAAQAAKAAVARSAVPLGTGSLGGRILNTEMKPLKGVTIKFRGVSAKTDEYGNFTMEDLPAGKRTILIDGSTSEEIGGHYPVIPISVDITAGLHNPMPFTPYLHRQKDYNYVNINPADDTVLTDPEVPGFEMRIPKGVSIIGWDGKANVKVSVRTVPTDRLPVKPIPNNSYIRTVYMFYFSKVGGGKPDRPIPIKSPNDLRLLPGEKAILWYYDESPNEGDAPNDWAIAGTGTVTPDGKYIVTDPGVGIPKFCCGATGWGGGGGGGGGGDCGGGCCGGGPAGPPSPPSSGGDPVNVSTGYFVYEHTDLTIPGIIPVQIKRFYRNRESGSAVSYSGSDGLGAFGKGTYFEYDWWLGIYTDMVRLIKPGNYQYDFAKQPDGSYLNTANPEIRGSRITVNADSTKTLRMRDGWSYKFDTYGELIEVADRNGNKITITRRHGWPDEGGYISTISNAEGRVLTFNQTYTGGNFIRTDSITDDTGRTVIYGYETDPFSAFPRLKQVSYPDGSSSRYGYDSQGRMNTITNGRGIVEVTNVYDTNNRVVTQTHPDGGQYTFNYTDAGGYVTQTAMTAPNGAQTIWRFNSNLYIGEYTTADGTATYQLAPGTNEIAQITDPLGRVTTYEYYSTTDVTNGLVKKVTDSIGNVTQYEYETTYGLPTKITDALGKITTSSYTFSNGVPTQTVIKDPLMNTTTVNYDAFGLPTSVVDPNNNAIFLTYDPNNHAQLTTATDALGNSLKYTYDAIGRLFTVTDAKGVKTTYGYDPLDRVNSVTDPLKNTTRYIYDGNGNLALVIDAKQNAILYEYDDRDRVIKMTDQLGRYETYSYYRNAEITPSTGDNLKTYTDRKGQATTFNQYDPKNRLQQVTFGDSSYIQYMYDAAGRTTNIYDSISGAIGYTYNDYGCSTCGGRGLNRIAEETTPLSTIDYTYDADGRRASMTVAGEPVVNYTYDDAGRLTYLTRVIGSLSRTYNLGYDNGSRRTSLESPLANGTDYVTTTYGFDIANRLTSMLLQGASVTIESLAYTYDPNGNRTSFTRTAAQPLSPAVSSTSHDAANQMLALGGKNLTYDQNGNLQTRTDVCGTTTYTWDARNRLTGISGYKPDCSSLTTSFSYDALNRRISKTINGTTTQFVYDGWDIVQEIKSGVKTNYVRSLNIDEPLTRITGATIRHYVKDALGSIMALVDDTGATMTTYVYDAFGNATTSGEASDNSFQYTARENDGTGLYYYRARYFSPEMQRFISEDPIRLNGGDINYFAYVQNNPINFTDPYGLFAWVNPFTYWGDFYRGTRDFTRNYQDMRDANTIGADKYFHCMANCQAAREGLGGRDAAALISEGRELTDQYIKGDRRSDCDADRAANRQGRNGDPNTPCSQACGSLRPNGLNPRY
jgi:RHS repeat-associated protein